MATLAEIIQSLGELNIRSHPGENIAVIYDSEGRVIGSLTATYRVKPVGVGLEFDENGPIVVFDGFIEVGVDSEY